MTQQQLINQTKEKIKETLLLITNYKQELISKENTLISWLKELTQIEQKPNPKKIQKPWK